MIRMNGRGRMQWRRNRSGRRRSGRFLARTRVGQRIRVIQPRQALGEDIRGPLLAHRGPFGCTLGHILLRRRRHAVRSLGDHQQLLEVSKIGCRLDKDVDVRRIGSIRHHLVHHPHG